MARRKKQPEVQPFQYSERVKIEPGDKIRVSRGPYFPTSDGRSISMGESGVFRFVREDEGGKGIWVQKNERESPRFVYMGEERVSEATGTHFRPHKIVKIRKKKKT